MIYYIYCTRKLFIGPSSQHYYTTIVFFNVLYCAFDHLM